MVDLGLNLFQSLRRRQLDHVVVLDLAISRSNIRRGQFGSNADFLRDLLPLGALLLGRFGAALRRQSLLLLLLALQQRLELVEMQEEVLRVERGLVVKDCLDFRADRPAKALKSARVVPVVAETDLSRSMRG